MSVESLVNYIKSHRCYSHPIFENWAKANPSKEVVAALFHQIRSFCDATRPAHKFAEALVGCGLDTASGLVQEIVDSEENHGPELIAMAGHVVNSMGETPECADVNNQERVEAYLKAQSDKLLGDLPGYDHDSGLLVQTRTARAVFDGRKSLDKDITIKNLGVTLALEIISHNHLIPGEKHCLIDSGLYNISLSDAPMHYLEEHYGETGAECMHEQAAHDALAAVMTEDNKAVMFAGAQEFLDSLVSVWDALDSALLGSGYLAKAA